MKKSLTLLLLFACLLACKNEVKSSPEKGIVTEEDLLDPSNKDLETIKEQSIAELKTKLVKDGYQVFDYVDEKTKDTTLMQQYFIAFLKRGPIRNQNEEEANRLQSEHLAHLGKMYELGYADISGPFGDDGDIRGITIYNVPTLKMADSLANADPMVKAGRLIIEVHPWWAAKGFPLR
ncbi:YciI family protein [uncultured Winogradskyella sp.]|uniref:YciI family protein n=1 Tax=uncultured Winogradskyella sp. TaxID=395353 RepID=UPI002617FC11|nr:YciI family protein [uncultured Winogradskyella sp.]